MTVFKRLAMGLLVAVLLTACSDNDKDGDLGPAPLIDYKAEVGLKKLWRAQVGDGQGKTYNRMTPVTRGDLLYAASIDGHVAAFSKLDGDPVWSQRYKLPVSAGIGLGEDQLYLGTLDGEVLALAIDDGNKRWSKTLSSEVVGIPAESRDIVVARTVDGKISALDRISGEVRWTHAATVPVLTLRGYGQPVFHEQLVIVGQANGKLVALDRDSGKVRWENRVAIGQGRSEIERIVDVDGTPLLMDGLVVTASYQGRMLAYQAESGRPVWQAEASTYHDLATGFGNIYVVDKYSQLLALSKYDGTVKWQQEAMSRRHLTAPQTLNSYIFVADYEGYLHVLSQVDGHLVARRRVDLEGIRAPLKVEENLVIAFGNSGLLEVFELNNEPIQYYTPGGTPGRSEVMRKRGMHPDWPYRLDKE